MEESIRKMKPRVEEKQTLMDFKESILMVVSLQIDALSSTLNSGFWNDESWILSSARAEPVKMFRCSNRCFKNERTAQLFPKTLNVMKQHDSLKESTYTCLTVCTASFLHTLNETRFTAHRPDDSLFLKTCTCHSYPSDRLLRNFSCEIVKECEEDKILLLWTKRDEGTKRLNKNCKTKEYNDRFYDWKETTNDRHF